jgi:hypothetical protein
LLHQFGQPLAHDRATRTSEYVTDEKDTHSLDGNTLNQSTLRAARAHLGVPQALYFGQNHLPTEHTCCQQG